MDILVFDRHGDFDAQRLFETVAPDFVFVSTVGQGSDSGAHRRLRTRDNFVGQWIDGIQTKLVHHFEQALSPDGIGAGLSVKITHRRIRCADVGADDLEQFLVGLTGVEKLGDRDL